MKIKHLLAAGLLTLAAACTTLSLDAQVANAGRSITAGRAVSTQLLLAKKITVAQDKANEVRFDSMRAALQAATAANDAAKVAAIKADADKAKTDLEMK